MLTAYSTSLEIPAGATDLQIRLIVAADTTAGLELEAYAVTIDIIK